MEIDEIISNNRCRTPFLATIKLPQKPSVSSLLVPPRDEVRLKPYAFSGTTFLDGGRRRRSAFPEGGR
jgi:hypothetical protein